MDISKNKVKLSQLLLDPNNYRFVDSVSYVPVEDKDVADVRVQARTRNILIGKGQENIRDLITSFKNNGYLDIEPIQVKPIAENKMFLVLEGNRRVATLKYLQEQFDISNDTGKVNANTFNNIEVKIITDDDEKSHLIAMGLHHISGKKKWNPLNQSQMVNDLLTNYSMTEDEVCQSLGISKQMVRRYERSLALIRAYKDSDYGDQFKSDMYSFFEETVKSPSMREWLEWDDEEMQSHNSHNQERLFTWFSRQEDTPTSEESESDQKTTEPIIEKSSDIRTLQQFIKDDNALLRMEKYGNVAEGFAYSDYVRRQRVENAISDLDRSVDAINGAEDFESKDLSSLIKISDKLQSLLKTDISLSEHKSELFKWEIKTLFSAVDIISFRGFTNLQIKNLSRINLFVGANNSGKTSVLEAIFLFTQLNDINRCVDIEKLRGKIDGKISKNWLLYNMPTGYEIKGLFNNVECSTKTIRTSEDTLNLDKQNYLGTLSNESIVNLKESTSMQTTLRLYAGRENQLNYSTLMNLCRSCFSSPYRKDRNMFLTIHGKVVEMGLFKTLLKFLQDNFDEEIESIELANIGGSMRFLIKSKYSDIPLELTKYGEGLQRVFEITLYMLYCSNGCLFIDELDSAIHKNLLSKFVQFINQLSIEHNVQVFISTHSKECVDTISKIISENNLSAYRMGNHENSYVLTYCNGQELKNLIENFDYDIR